MDEGSGQQQKRDKDGWSEGPAERRGQREDRENEGEVHEFGWGIPNMTSEEVGG